MKRKNILITGASGSVGSEILKQLSDQTSLYDVTVFDLKTPESVKFLRQFEDKFKVVYGDISRVDDVEKVSHGKDYVIHLAAIIPPKADLFPEWTENVNVNGTKNLLRNLELYSPESFLVYASSIAVYGDRLKQPWIKVTDLLKPGEGDAYARTKIEAEAAIRASRLDWSIFRLTAIMGRHKLTELLFHMPLATQMEIATSIDTARAFIRAIDHRAELSGKIFNLGGGESYRISYQEFLRRSFEAVGLGKPDFPAKSFAEKNYHCGFYADGHVLEDILHFQSGNMDEYFYTMHKSTHFVKRFLTAILSRVIKKRLLQKSEPYRAYLSNDKRLKSRFFPSLFC